MIGVNAGVGVKAFIPLWTSFPRPLRTERAENQPEADLRQSLSLRDVTLPQIVALNYSGKQNTA